MWFVSISLAYIACISYPFKGVENFGLELVIISSSDDSTKLFGAGMIEMTVYAFEFIFRV